MMNKTELFLSRREPSKLAPLGSAPLGSCFKKSYFEEIFVINNVPAQP